MPTKAMPRTPARKTSKPSRRTACGRATARSAASWAGVDLRTANWLLVESDQRHAVFRRRLPERGLEIVKTYRLAEVPEAELPNKNYPALSPAVRRRDSQHRRSDVRGGVPTGRTERFAAGGQMVRLQGQPKLGRFGAARFHNFHGRQYADDGQHHDRRQRRRPAAVARSGFAFHRRRCAVFFRGPYARPAGGRRSLVRRIAADMRRSGRSETQQLGERLMPSDERVDDARTRRRAAAAYAKTVRRPETARRCWRTRSTG